MNEQEFLDIQNSLREKINLTDSFRTEEIKTVAGIDLAYWEKDGLEYAVCCIVVIDYKTHEILEKKQSHGKIEVPYIAGFLAFRELPLILETVKKLDIQPDLFMFDGNGTLHPRNMGIATHASFYLKKACIGVAKSYYRVRKGLDYSEPDSSAGSFTDIVCDGKIYGRVLRTHTGVKPVFVSAGNFISLDTATRITMELTGKESHIPVPTRLADLETHTARQLLKINNS
ncbi:MAG: endonuclease V [Muribaculaceae bacterium]|nr:endonuclease V [Alistipes senegalensis]MCM1472692.1 endonuclease V [Muribaculaceae bacterium]